MQFGWVNMRAYDFFVCGPKFNIFFSPNVGGIVDDQLLFRLSICGSNPEIFREFLDLHYQEHTHCDHVAKFRGDRPTEFGGSPANKNKEKTPAVKYKTFR